MYLTVENVLSNKDITHTPRVLYNKMCTNFQLLIKIKFNEFLTNNLSIKLYIIS